MVQNNESSTQTPTITAADFAMYEAVRKSGRTNMYAPLARKLAGLTRDQHLYILQHYQELCALYLPERLKGQS